MGGILGGSGASEAKQGEYSKKQNNRDECCWEVQCNENKEMARRFGNIEVDIDLDKNTSLCVGAERQTLVDWCTVWIRNWRQAV